MVASQAVECTATSNTDQTNTVEPLNQETPNKMSRTHVVVPNTLFVHKTTSESGHLINQDTFLRPI